MFSSRTLPGAQLLVVAEGEGRLQKWLQSCQAGPMLRPPWLFPLREHNGETHAKLEQGI